MPDALMIFAAGFGTRMGALTRDRPKPMVPLAGRPMIDRTLDLARDAGLTRIVANAHYHADQIADHLAPGGVTVVAEEPHILDTGGGLKAALPQIGPGPVFTINPDALWLGPNPLSVLRAAWQDGEMEALLLCVPPDRAKGRSGPGDFSVDGQGRVSRGGPFVYGGAQIIRTDALAGIGERVFSLNLLWDILGRRGTLFAAEYPGDWCDIGTPDGLALAETLLRDADV